MSDENKSYETLLTEIRGSVALVTLNRPKALNALNSQLMAELADVLSDYAKDDAVGAVVLTGSEKAFAAGADIKEMQGLNFVDAYLGDFIIASDTAKFGQPEITLGVIPGAGGSQRLTRAVGKAKAMDLVLTGRMMDAAEAERAGLVSRIVPTERLIDEAVEAAAKIAGFPAAAVMMAKEAVNRSFEVTLTEGLRFERRLFHSLFATEDQKEGMAAFAEKRKPTFRNR